MLKAFKIWMLIMFALFCFSTGNKEIVEKTDENCLKFSNNKCTECKENYALSTTGKCFKFKCSDLTLRCIECNLGFCTKCQPGYFPLGWITCHKCSSYYNQLNLTMGYCQECNPKLPGYSKNAQGKCFKCGDNCLECDELTCTKCKEGYDRDNGGCKLKCSKNAQGKCFKCSDNCLVCDELTCTKCEEGYVKYNGGCKLKCEAVIGDGCLTCNKELTKCLSCGEKYFLDTDLQFQKARRCHKCSVKENNCLKCLVKNKALACTQCEPNYVILNKKCILCDKVSNCTNCDGVKCSSCKSGFRLYEGKCFKDCMHNSYCCLECEKNECKKCCSNNKYYLDPHIKKCIDCTGKFGDNCLSCDINSCNLCKKPYFSFNGRCLLCSSFTGYYFNKDKEICERCGNKFPNCLLCKEDKRECTECRMGFTLKNGICVSCNSINKNCQICIDNFCTRCSLGYIPSHDNKTCDIKNCMKKENQICKKCNKGFYLNKEGNNLPEICKSCKSFDQFCMECDQKDKCQDCVLHAYMDPVAKHCKCFKNFRKKNGGCYMGGGEALFMNFLIIILVIFVIFT